ncbi:MAG TPA: histidine phosphatase family protein [Nocardioidaceae bacterium]|jgi:probable phosphomutase (TIGR03848 family)
MATVLLVRHGRSTANSSGVLAGQAPGVLLDDVGKEQAQATGARIAPLPVRALVTSPLERCHHTAEAIAGARSDDLEIVVDDRLTECGYGDWTGHDLKQLAKDPLWKAVQAHPSGVTFPGGESMRAMQARGVEAVREWDRRVTDEHGPDALWVAVSHADVIKAIVADALGTHLDNFQRIVIDPGSVSVISYTPLRPFVVRYNDHGELVALIPPKRRRGRKKAGSDAVVGGGAGSAAAP